MGVAYGVLARRGDGSRNAGSEECWPEGVWALRSAGSRMCWL